MSSAASTHGFHTLRVARIDRETSESVSLVLDVPDELREAYRYRAGQFCTFRAEVEGATLLRCYSMSSSPDVDDELKVTVKAVPDGRVSGWMNRALSAGDEIDVTPPAGVFCLGDDDGGPLLLFAAGSGITPIISLAKTALATTDRPVRLLYANRDRPSTIFAAELEALADQHADRLAVRHHLDVDDGYVDAGAVADVLAGADLQDGHAYVCGPTPFMDLVEAALLDGGLDADRLHIERFTPADDLDESAAALADAPSDGIEITIDLDGRVETTTHREGTTILQTARQLGMDPPYSCEAGSCATCMGRLESGTVTMHVNDALDDDEVAEGFVLTCQSVPTSGPLKVVYGYD